LAKADLIGVASNCHEALLTWAGTAFLSVLAHVVDAHLIGVGEQAGRGRAVLAFEDLRVDDPGGAVAIVDELVGRVQGVGLGREQLPELGGLQLGVDSVCGVSAAALAEGAATEARVKASAKVYFFITLDLPRLIKEGSSVEPLSSKLIP
jgi:hypothetical protein